MRILVVRIGRAGDIIMTTPALSAIFDLYPNAEVVALTGPDGRRLLKNFHSRLTDIWVWNRSSLHNFFDKREIIKKLTLHSFDVIFCFDTSRHIAGIFKNTNAKLYQPSTSGTLKHSAEIYLDTVEQATGTLKKSYYARLPVNEHALKAIEDELLTHDITSNDIVIMLHPSYSGYSNNSIKRFFYRKNRSLMHRLWSTENFSKLADLLSTYKNKDGLSPKIIIDLIPEEISLGEIILQGCRKPITLLQVKPNFERYKALIKRANLLIVPNTGPMHIAAAVNTKVVALFSNWSSDDCGPYMKPSQFKIVRAEDMPNSARGLNAIPPESVMQACKQLLD